MSNSPLIDHAMYELQRAGMFDKDADYGGAIAPAVMEVVEVVARQEHSGGSHAVLMMCLDRLLRFEPLTPLTSDPSEWIDQSEISGTPMWPNKRDSATFSHDGGKTWYSLKDKR